jgi:uridine kinase
MIQRYADLAAAVRESPPRLGRVRVVAVDGPSGAGKTIFAGRLADALRATGCAVELVHTDDLLDGWEDTVTFWPRLADGVLKPLRSGEAGSYHAYHWGHGRFEVQARAVPVPDVLVVEGVTAARRAMRAELALSVFVSAPPGVRLSRALARDGEEIREPLLAWREREEAFFAADGTREAADLLVDGAPEIAHDPVREFVVWRPVPM